jgi:hypothetical protein
MHCEIIGSSQSAVLSFQSLLQKALFAVHRVLPTVHCQLLKIKTYPAQF